MKINKYNRPRDDARGESTARTVIQTVISGGGTSGGGGEVDHASTADQADYATIAGNLDPTSSDWTTIDNKYLRKDTADTAAGEITFSSGLKVGSNTSWSISSIGNAILNAIQVAGKWLRKIVTSTDAISEQGVGADDAVLSEKKALGTMLRKDQNDSTTHRVAFGGGIEVGSYQTGALGTGGAINVDGNGNSLAEFDFLTVRKAASFRSISILELKHIGGELGLTAGAMKVSAVEELTSTWRCYFETTDGTKTVYQEFVARDQARCQTFRLAQDGSGMLTTKYYWRLVIGAGSNYIDLSKTDCDTGSMDPEVGDEIIQLGYRGNDRPERQSAIILSAVASDAPSVKYYQGINSYSLTGAIVKDDGYDATTGLFHTYTYGESYVGASDESTYMKFTPSDGVEIKGKVEMTSDSTVGGSGVVGKAEFDLTTEAIQARVDGASTGTVFDLPSSIESTGYNVVLVQEDVYLSKGLEYYLYTQGEISGNYDSIIVSVRDGSTVLQTVMLDKDNLEKSLTFLVNADGWYQLMAVGYVSSGGEVELVSLSLEQPSLQSVAHLDMSMGHISLGVEGMSNGNILEETDWRNKEISYTAFNDRGAWSSSNSYNFLDKVTHWEAEWVLLGAESVQAGAEDPYHWSGSDNPWVELSVYESATKLTKWSADVRGGCAWLVQDAYRRMAAVHMKRDGDYTVTLSQTVDSSKIVAGGIYTFSLYYRARNYFHLFLTNFIDTSASLVDEYGETGAALINGHAVAYNGTDEATGVKIQANPILPSTDWKWEFISITFMASSSSGRSFALHAYTSDTEIEATMLKMEAGSKATPWTELTKDTLKRSGIDIDAEKIIATTDNFEIRNSNDDMTFSVNGDGDLEAVGTASFKGTLRARTIYNSILHLDLVAADFTAGQSSTFYDIMDRRLLTDRPRMDYLPDFLVVTTSVQRAAFTTDDNYEVILPDPTSAANVGKLLEVFVYISGRAGGSQQVRCKGIRITLTAYEYPDGLSAGGGYIELVQASSSDIVKGRLRVLATSNGWMVLDTDQTIHATL